RVKEAVDLTSFKFEVQSGDILCWLTTVNEYVDDEVQELAELIDHSLFLPSKIVMLSIAETADDATNQQLQEWYGQQENQNILAQQYAVKMIDEFEFPYTIIRALPITNEETSLKVVSEGNPLEGKEIGLGQVAQIIEQAVTTDDFRN